MENSIVISNTTKFNKFLYFLAHSFFYTFIICLTIIIIMFGRGNIRSDSVDYYAITQRLASPNSSPIVDNLHFVEQRAPGYPVICLIPYTIISYLVEPFVKTENIITPHSQFPTYPMQDSTEEVIFPREHILVRNIFFKNFYIPTDNSWFEWKIILSMLVTSYIFLFIGLITLAKLTFLENKSLLVITVIPFIIITSRIFIHNIVNTPSYATLTAFGISSLFVYFFIKSFIEKKSINQMLSGLFVGFLVITRLETIVIAIVVMVSLIILKEFKFLKNFLLGNVLPLFILLSYNYSQFGNIFHLGIFKGDVNFIMIDWIYIYHNILNPESGMLFWSSLETIGLMGLFLHKKIYAKIFAAASLVFICLIVVRVPIMYICMGEGLKIIGGLPIMCCNSIKDALRIICFDANRYITVLIPFSVIGFGVIISSITTLFRRLK